VERGLPGGPLHRSDSPEPSVAATTDVTVIAGPPRLAGILRRRRPVR
jgi:hypothetical protein